MELDTKELSHLYTAESRGIRLKLSVPVKSEFGFKKSGVMLPLPSIGQIAD